MSNTCSTISFLSFTMSLLVCSVSGNAMIYFMAHRPEKTICCVQAGSICCFHFYYLCLEAGGYFYLCKFNVYSMMCFIHSLPKQMLALDKIFMTPSSTTFVHTRRYNQYQIKVSWSGFNKFDSNVQLMPVMTYLTSFLLNFFVVCHVWI